MGGKEWASSCIYADAVLMVGGYSLGYSISNSYELVMEMSTLYKRSGEKWEVHCDVVI